METLQNGYTLNIAPGTFPLSTDSIALSGFAEIKKDSAVLDLGSGCGTLGLLLCARNDSCRVTGIELDEKAHAAAVENIARNHLESRLSSVYGDLRNIRTLITAGSFDVCISNPPYFSGGPVSSTVPTARHDGSCTTKELFDAAAWALRWGGDLFLVHKPERLAQLMSCAVSAGLEPKKLQLLRHTRDKQISLILLQCRKGAKPGLIIDELCLHEADGSPTGAYRKLYHI